MGTAAIVAHRIRVAGVVGGPLVAASGRSVPGFRFFGRATRVF